MNQTIMPSTMVSTMAGGPQVVTFALDDLLGRGETIQNVIIVHLSPQADPVAEAAIATLTAEFQGDAYAGRPCRLRFFPIRKGNVRLDDIRDEGDANAAWSAIYGLIAELKAQGQRLHVCISGGRRMLALQAMSAAMLHFDHDDRLWHMYTPREFLKQAGNGAIMHAKPQDGVRLIRVPMMPWGAYLPGLRQLAQPTPNAVMTTQARALGAGEHARCQRAIERLTPRQIDVLHAFAAGQSPQDVAESLGITLKTVDTHKTAILAECRVTWGLPEDERLSYHFLQTRFGRFCDPDSV